MKNKKIVLAPMAGYTNVAFRNIASIFPVDLVYTEMISDKGLLYDNKRTMEMASTKKDVSKVAIQLFGYEIDEMVKAAKILDKTFDAEYIDINMGCPVKKVIKSKSGAYHMKDIDHSYELVKALCENVSKKISVKIRLGWDNEGINCVEFAKAMEKAGASLIAIHGRTKAQMYKGVSSLEYIKKVKDAVSIPVYASGDIKSGKKAYEVLEKTGVDGIMIGRAAMGNPWIFSEIDAFLKGKEFKKPSLHDKIKMIRKHLKLLMEIKPEKIAVLEMRGLAVLYLKGERGIRKVKIKIVQATTAIELEQILTEIEELRNENKTNEN